MASPGVVGAGVVLAGVVAGGVVGAGVLAAGVDVTAATATESCQALPCLSRHALCSWCAVTGAEARRHAISKVKRGAVGSGRLPSTIGFAGV